MLHKEYQMYQCLKGMRFHKNWTSKQFIGWAFAKCYVFDPNNFLFVCVSVCCAIIQDKLNGLYSNFAYTCFLYHTLSKLNFELFTICCFKIMTISRVFSQTVILLHNFSQCTLNRRYRKLKSVESSLFHGQKYNSAT